MKFDETFSKEGLASILTSIKEIRSGIFFLEHVPYFSVSETLKELWEPQPLSDYAYQIPPPSEKRYIEVQKKLRVCRIEPGWLIAISNQFTKDIQNIDRKLQGRILAAIGAIYKDPTTAKGDTIKPLGADLKGLWRYRIGDHRLVYDIDNENKHIVLIAFASRGEVYEP